MTTVDEAELLLFDASAICTPSGVEANHLFAFAVDYVGRSRFTIPFTPPSHNNNLYCLHNFALLIYHVPLYHVRMFCSSDLYSANEQSVESNFHCCGFSFNWHFSWPRQR